MKLFPGLGALARRFIIQFHNYPLSMSFLYREIHTRQFMSKAVSDNAIFFWDYKDYARYNARLFSNHIKSNAIPSGRAACLEFGVSTGATTNLLSEALPEYKLFGFDSFEGFVSVKEGSIWAGFQNRFKNQQVPKLNDNVELVTGYVEQTFPDFAKSKLRDALALFVHLDLDIYEPTKVVLEWIANANLKAFVMFDEFINYDEFHLHEYRAFLETIIDRNVPFRVRSLCDRGARDYGQFGKVCVEIR